MPTFTLMIREVWVRSVQIEAGSLKEAMRAHGKGTQLDPNENLEYSHCLDVDTWTAEDDQSNTYYGDDLAAIAKELGDERRQQENLPGNH
jgi:hypothetical protein